MKFKIYSISIFLLFFSSCKKEKESVSNTKSPITIKIDSNDNEPTIFTHILNDFYFVVLENSEESMLSGADKIFFFKDEFYVFDDKYNKIVVFSGTGDFLRTIGKIGAGPGEFKDIGDISFDYENNKIQVLSIYKNKILNFNPDGGGSGYFRQKFPMMKFANLNSKYYAYFVGYFAEDFFNLKITNKDHKVVFKGFPFPEDHEEDLMKSTFTGYLTSYDDHFLYSDATSSKIYSIYPDGLINLKYFIDFGKNPWSEKNIYKHETFFQKIIKGEVSFLRSHYEENDKALVFCYNYSVTNDPKKRTNFPKLGFYLKKSGKVYTHFNYGNDLLYPYLTAPKGKTKNGEYFISTLKNVDGLMEELNKMNHSTGIAKQLDSLFTNSIINPESTILFLYKFK